MSSIARLSTLPPKVLIIIHRVRGGRAQAGADVRCWLQLGDGHFIEIMAVSDRPPASHGSNWTTVSKREIWKQMSIKTRYKMLCNGEWEQLQVWSRSNKMLRYFPAWRRSAETGFWPRTSPPFLLSPPPRLLHTSASINRYTQWHKLLLAPASCGQRRHQEQKYWY